MAQIVSLPDRRDRAARDDAPIGSSGSSFGVGDLARELLRPLMGVTRPVVRLGSEGRRRLVLRSMLVIPTELAASTPMPLPSGASNSFDESRFRRSLSWTRKRVSAVDCTSFSFSVDSSFVGSLGVTAFSTLASLTLRMSVGAGPTLTAKSDDVHVTAQVGGADSLFSRWAASCPWPWIRWHSRRRQASAHS